MSFFANDRRDASDLKQYHAKEILNLAIAGHSGSGKTSIAEAMLKLSGATDRLGKISDGNTVCDYDPEEIRRKTSVSASIAPLEWKNRKINLIDAPGLLDFAWRCRRSVSRSRQCADYHQREKRSRSRN
jgi:translation elongation factor EF-G